MRLPAILLVSTFAFASTASAEGAFPPPGVAPTPISLGESAKGDHAGDGAFVFRNEGAASLRLLLPATSARAVACTPDGVGVSYSRAGQFTLSGGAELACTAPSGRHRFTAITAEGGSVREIEGRLVVR